MFNGRYGTRYCNLPPHTYVRSSVSKAMARINMILNPKVHQHQDNINISQHSVEGNNERESGFTESEFLLIMIIINPHNS